MPASIADHRWPAVHGQVGHGKQDDGDPVKTGGRFSSSTVGLSHDQRGDSLLDDLGHPLVPGALQIEHEQTLLASASRDATTNVADQVNRYFKGATFYLDTTLVGADAEGTALAAVNVRLQTKDPVSGSYSDIPGASFLSASTTALDVITIYPGIGETANETISDVLPRTYRAVADQSGTVTYSLGVQYHQ